MTDIQGNQMKLRNQDANDNVRFLNKLENSTNGIDKSLTRLGVCYWDHLLDTSGVTEHALEN